MQSNAVPQTNFLRLPAVRKICGDVSPATIWNWVRNSDKTGFPRPIKLSENCTAWNAAEIEEWAQSRVQTSRSDKAPVCEACGHPHL